MPIGIIVHWGNSTPPVDWLICDGSAVSRSTYSALFAIIGTSFGPGDGSTTFNLPDPRGRSFVGVGTGSGLSPRVLGATGGEESHVLTTAEGPSHTHAQQSNTILDNAGAASVVSGIGAARLVGGTTGSSGSGTAHNTMHPFLNAYAIIKYQ